MIGNWHGVVIDCTNPQTLASFYEQLLGYVRVNNESDWVVIGKSADHPGIAFQRIENYQAPHWPSGTTPTQMHLDIRVDDLDVACQQAQDIGAKLLHKASEIFWVLADPEGHPFCLVKLT